MNQHRIRLVVVGTVRLYAGAPAAIGENLMNQNSKLSSFTVVRRSQRQFLAVIFSFLQL